MAKEKKPLESELLREICDWLYSQHSYFFWRSNNIPVFTTNNAGQRRFISLPKYGMRGLPDIMMISKGYFVGIEVKREGKHLRPEQREFKASCEGRGGIYLEVHSCYELEQKLASLDL